MIIIKQDSVIKDNTEPTDIKSCYICESSNFIKRSGTVRDCPSIEINECLDCGLVFLSSREHINDSFYESSKMHDVPIDVYSWLNETQVDDQRRYNFLRRLMENKNILDFGCGNGGFLSLARQVAQNVSGVELDRSVQEHFKKERINLWHSIDEIKGNFNIITLFHVLEHIPDPKYYLIKLSEHLSKEGYLIVEVPNANDILLSIYKSEAFSNFTYWSCHLFLFNPFTLQKLAEKAGLKVNYIKQVQRYPLSNHLYWLAKGKPGGHQVWSFLNSTDLHIAYEKQLAAIGACDTLIACFSKI